MRVRTYIEPKLDFVSELRDKDLVLYARKWLSEVKVYERTEKGWSEGKEQEIEIVNLLKHTSKADITRTILIRQEDAERIMQGKKPSRELRLLMERFRFEIAKTYGDIMTEYINATINKIKIRPDISLTPYLVFGIPDKVYAMFKMVDENTVCLDAVEKIKLINMSVYYIITNLLSGDDIKRFMPAFDEIKKYEGAKTIEEIRLFVDKANKLLDNIYETSKNIVYLRVGGYIRDSINTIKKSVDIVYGSVKVGLSIRDVNKKYTEKGIVKYSMSENCYVELIADTGYLISDEETVKSYYSEINNIQDIIIYAPRITTQHEIKIVTVYASIPDPSNKNVIIRMDKNEHSIIEVPSKIDGIKRHYNIPNLRLLERTHRYIYKDGKRIGGTKIDDYLYDIFVVGNFKMTFSIRHLKIYKYKILYPITIKGVA
jgi:hypothetical protein